MLSWVSSSDSKGKGKERARPLFAGLARTVEDSLFGGRPVGEPRWHEAREAYGSFALPETWRA